MSSLVSGAGQAAGFAGAVAGVLGVGRQPVLLYDPDRAVPLEFDAVVTETHTATAVVTKHPVEKGADITDHVKPEPRTIQLSDAVVTNTPISLAGIIRAQGIPSFLGGPAEHAWAQLEAWRRSSTPLTLVTSLQIYDMVAIESLDVPRDAARSKAMVASITLDEILTVETSVTTGPKPARDGAAGTKTQGLKPKTPLDDTSALRLGAEAIRGESLPMPPKL